MGAWLALALGAALVSAPAVARAEPVVEVRVEGDAAKTVEALGRALRERGLAVRRTFDVSQGLEGRGVRFMPYVLVLLEADRGVEAALAQRPSLAGWLPPTVYVYSRRPGEVTLGALGVDRLLGFASLSPPAEQGLRATFQRMYAAMASLGGPGADGGPRGFGPAMPVGPAPPAEGGRVAGAVTFRLGGMALDEAQAFLQAALQGYNLNVVDSLTVGPVRQLLACSLSYAEAIFADAPGFGAVAPCRVFLYADGPDVVVGTVDLDLWLSVFPGLGSRAREAAQEAYGLMLKAFEEMGAR